MNVPTWIWYLIAGMVILLVAANLAAAYLPIEDFAAWSAILTSNESEC